MSRVTRRPVAAPVAQEAVRDGAALRARWGLRLWLLLSVLAGGVMVAGLAEVGQRWLRETPISHVVIAGELAQTDRPALQAALERTVRGNFFNANLSDLAAVARRFPWVASVTVSRQWPDAVRVRISEKQAVARWSDDGLVASTGEVFRPSHARGVDTLPLLAGPRAQAAYVLAEYREMDKVLRRVGLRIDRLALTERMSWQLTLEGDIQLLVDNQDMLAKLERFTLLYDRQLASDIASIARIDLRYRNGVAIGWRQG